MATDKNIKNKTLALEIDTDYTFGTWWIDILTSQESSVQGSHYWGIYL